MFCRSWFCPKILGMEVERGDVVFHSNVWILLIVQRLLSLLYIYIPVASLFFLKYFTFLMPHASTQFCTLPVPCTLRLTRDEEHRLDKTPPSIILPSNPHCSSVHSPYPRPPATRSTWHSQFPPRLSARASEQWFLRIEEKLSQRMRLTSR